MTEIHYEWIPVTLDGIPFEFSSEIAKRVGRLPQSAAIYRWVFLKRGVVVKAYIGETENLSRRIRGYLNPGPSQETNKRIHAEFETALAIDLNVRLELLRIEPVYLNKVLICVENFCDPFVRRMLENFVLADSDSVNCEILNRVLNPIERRKYRAMKRDLNQAAEQESK